jgi:stage II sporulation protein M
MKKQKKKSKYSESFSYIKESKSYILAITSLFIFSILVGLIFPIFFEEQILEILKEMLGIFDGKNLVETIFLIFLNNLRASLFIILLGIFFGIFPIVSAIFNGYLIGFVVRLVVAEEGLFVIWRLLPHGIFELPAVLISMGLGLKIGFELFKKNPEKTLKRNFKESIKVFLRIILPLLVLAAFIEGSLIYLVG